MADEYDQQTGEIIEPGRNLPAAPEPSRPNNLIFASQECAEVFGALSLAQGQMANPKKTKTAKVKGTTRGGANYEYDYKYAPLEEVVDSIRKPMSEAKLVYRQFLASRDGQWVMRTIIAHASGQWFGCDYPIFTGRQEGAQGFASGVTYARRYGLMLALGIVAEDDDDANVADGRPAEISGRDGAAPASAPRQQQRAAPQAAPASASRDEAIKRHREMVSEIDNAHTAPEIDEILRSQAWQQMEKHIHAADPGEKGDNVIAKLRDRANQRKSMLLAEPETEGYGDAA